jgi:hypothetical protein
MVEAPGTAPGSATPILNNVYCHSQLRQDHSIIFFFLWEEKTLAKRAIARQNIEMKNLKHR